MNAPAGETRRPVTVNLEVEFEGFSGKERFPDALMYPKGLLLRTRYLKPVGTPATFTVLDQEGTPIGGRGQVVFSRWQDQGPRRPAGLGIRIDEWEGDSEARTANWFEPPSQFDLVDAQSVPAASQAAAEAPPASATARAAAPSAEPAAAAPSPAESAAQIATVAGPPVEAAASAARWMAEDVPPSMPDLSLRYGQPGGGKDAAVVEDAAPPESDVDVVAEATPPFRPVWEPVADARSAGAGLPKAAPLAGAETMRIPSDAVYGDSPRAGSHVTRQQDSGAEPGEPFRPRWTPPSAEYAALAEARPPVAPQAAQAPVATVVNDLPVGREGDVVWLPPAKPRLLPWILAGVLLVLAAGGGYYVYATRFASQAMAVAPPPAEPVRAPAAQPDSQPSAPSAEPGPSASTPGAATPGAASPGQPTASPTLPPASEPAAAPPPAAVPARRFAALSGVSWTTEGDALVLRLSLDGSASERDAQQFRVSGPPAREVVKLRGCRPPATRRFEVRDSRLLSVRVGEQPGGDLHVVLDLADGKVTVTPLAIDGATLVLRLRR